MSGRLYAAIISVLTAGVIAAALIIRLPADTAQDEPIGARSVQAEEIMTGSDDYQGPPTELLPGYMININTADETELDALPGIGPALSSAIVSYRTENGAFESIEDIMKVSGIGEGKFAAICEHITVEDAK